MIKHQNDYDRLLPTVGSIVIKNKALSDLTNIRISNMPFLRSLTIENKALSKIKVLTISNDGYLQSIQFTGGNYFWFKASAESIVIQSKIRILLWT